MDTLDAHFLRRGGNAAGSATTALRGASSHNPSEMPLVSTSIRRRLDVLCLVHSDRVLTFDSFSLFGEDNIDLRASISLRICNIIENDGKDDVSDQIRRICRPI